MSERQYVRREDVLTRSFADRVLIAARDRNDVVVLSGPATVAWALLERPLVATQVVQEVAKHYGRPPQTIAAEVDALLADLLGKGLLSGEEA